MEYAVFTFFNLKIFSQYFKYINFPQITLPRKIPNFYVYFDKSVLKFIREIQTAKNNQDILNKNMLGGIVLAGIKIYIYIFF